MNVSTNPPDQQLLCQLIQDGQWDRALDAGLMEWTSDNVPSDVDAHALSQILSLQRQFRRTWSARDRYRRRNARLAASSQHVDSHRTSNYDEQEETTHALSAHANQLLAQAKAEAEAEAEADKP